MADAVRDLSVADDDDNADKEQNSKAPVRRKPPSKRKRRPIAEGIDKTAEPLPKPAGLSEVLTPSKRPHHHDVGNVEDRMTGESNVTPIHKAHALFPDKETGLEYQDVKKALRRHNERSIEDQPVDDDPLSLVSKLTEDVPEYSPAQGASPGLKDDRQRLDAWLCRSQPVGYTSLVKHGGPRDRDLDPDCYSPGKRTDSINGLTYGHRVIYAEKFAHALRFVKGHRARFPISHRTKLFDGACTWVGHTQDEDPDAWEKAKGIALKRTKYSQKWRKVRHKEHDTGNMYLATVTSHYDHYDPYRDSNSIVDASDEYLNARRLHAEWENNWLSIQRKYPDDLALQKSAMGISICSQLWGESTGGEDICEEVPAVSSNDDEYLPWGYETEPVTNPPAIVHNQPRMKRSERPHVLQDGTVFLGDELGNNLVLGRVHPPEAIPYAARRLEKIGLFKRFKDKKVSTRKIEHARITIDASQHELDLASPECLDTLDELLDKNVAHYQILYAFMVKARDLQGLPDETPELVVERIEQPRAMCGNDLGIPPKRIPIDREDRLGPSIVVNPNRIANYRKFNKLATMLEDKEVWIFDAEVRLRRKTHQERLLRSLWYEIATKEFQMKKFLRDHPRTCKVKANVESHLFKQHFGKTRFKPLKELRRAYLRLRLEFKQNLRGESGESVPASIPPSVETESPTSKEDKKAEVVRLPKREIEPAKWQPSREAKKVSSSTFEEDFVIARSMIHARKILEGEDIYLEKIPEFQGPSLLSDVKSYEDAIEGRKKYLATG